MQQTNLPEQMFRAVEVLSGRLRNAFNGLIKIKIDLLEFSAICTSVFATQMHLSPASLSEVNGFLGAAFSSFRRTHKNGWQWPVAQSVWQLE